METSKRYFWNLLNVSLIMFIILAGFITRALHNYAESVSATRTISVSAEGKTVATPDIAKFNFSVVTEGKDTVKISSENVKKMNQAIDFVKSKGIDSKDIQTAGYDLSPKYEYDENKRTTFISGYTLRQAVYVKIRDFTKISEILGALPGLGINDISSLSFDIENKDQSLNSARQEAFDKAFAKAKAMAKQNRVRIKKVITFSEYQNVYPVYAKALGFGGDLAAPEFAPAPTIEPGSQEVTVNVSVTYEID